MAARFYTETFTADVLEAQERYYGRSASLPPSEESDALGPEEVAFIGERDSFYMATVASNGWPYVQHRGGAKGFLKALDPHTLAFADFRGNRQLISSGNVTGEQRVALILVDYPHRTRLKVLGRARILEPKAEPKLAVTLGAPQLGKRVERLFVIDVVSFDWNCAAYITPRFTIAEVEELAAPLRNRIAELEAELGRQKADRDRDRGPGEGNSGSGSAE